MWILGEVSFEFQLGGVIVSVFASGADKGNAGQGLFTLSPKPFATFIVRNFLRLRIYLRLSKDHTCDQTEIVIL